MLKLSPVNSINEERPIPNNVGLPIARVGRCWNLAGKDPPHLAIHSLYLVGPTEKGWCTIRYHRRETAEECAEVGNRTHLETEQFPIVLNGGLNVVHLTAPVRL